MWISLPLVMILVGSWLSDEDYRDPSALTMFLGWALELVAWVQFARLVGFFVIGPLILMIS